MVSRLYVELGLNTMPAKSIRQLVILCSGSSAVWAPTKAFVISEIKITAFFVGSQNEKADRLSDHQINRIANSLRERS